MSEPTSPADDAAPPPPAPPPLRAGPITQEQLAYYASASGDFNRIHLDAGYAREAGHPAPLVHGMLTMALMGRLLTRWAGPGAVRRLQARFLGATYVGDVITCEARVVGQRADVVVVEVSASRTDGTKTAAGTAEVAWPPPRPEDSPARAAREIK